MKLEVIRLTKEIVSGTQPIADRNEFELKIGNTINIDEDMIINVIEIGEDYVKVVINSRSINKEFIQYIIKDIEISITPNLLGEHRQYIFALS